MTGTDAVAGEVRRQPVGGSDQLSVVQSAMAGFSAARRSSCAFTFADARAMLTALAAVASTDARERSSVAANPQALSAITRMPMPRDSESAACATFPFLVMSVRERSSTMRASQ